MSSAVSKYVGLHYMHMHANLIERTSGSSVTQVHTNKEKNWISRILHTIQNPQSLLSLLYELTDA